MNCKKCGVKIDKDARFCTSCGTKVSEEPKKASPQQKFGKLIEKLKEHLEFLGYSFEIIPPANEAGKPILLGKHSTEYKLNFWELKEDIILFSIDLSTKTKSSNDLYEFANKANEKYLLARAYIRNGEPVASLKSEAVWIGEYSKERFAVFIDQLRNDVRQLNAIEGFDKLL